MWSASFFRAVSETRTRDPQLGKLMLYQLSYYRLCAAPVNGRVLFSGTNIICFCFSNK